MGIIGLKFKSKINTRYDYQPEMADRVKYQIIRHFAQDLKIRARLQGESVKFNSYLEIMTFNPIITLFGLTVDSGMINTVDNSGKLQVVYTANSIRGLIISFLLASGLGYMGVKIEAFNLLSFQTLLIISIPFAFYFFLKIFGLRILVVIIEKSLKNRNKTTANI